MQAVHSGGGQGLTVHVDGGEGRGSEATLRHVVKTDNGDIPRHGVTQLDQGADQGEGGVVVLTEKGGGDIAAVREGGF